MSFLKKIKNALGIGTYEESDPLVTTPENEILVNEAAPNLADADTVIEVSPEIMKKIFEKVVEVTNTAIPAYFKQSVDTERQKKYLYDALDASVKEYLVALDEKSQAKCMAVWQKERDELRTQMETLKQRAADLESQRSEMNEQKLSGDRQRRALSERAHDLEVKVMQLEAEKEQYEIENRGLINKAKVASVYESDMEAMKQELDMLRKTASTEKVRDEIDKLNQEINYLKAENTKLTESCQAAKVKDEMSESMLNNLQKRASESQHNVKELEKKIEELEKEEQVKKAQIDDLTKQLDEKNARLAENEQTFEEFEKIASQLDAFEDIKKKYEERIQKLKDELASAQKAAPQKAEAQIDNVPRQPAPRKDGDQANQPQQHQAPKPSKEQIEKLKTDPIAGQDFSFDDYTL